MNTITSKICKAVVVILLFSCNSSAQSKLSVQDFEKAIQQKDIQLLDVRTPGEYESGHLADAFLANWNNKPEFTERVAALDKSKPVYVYCLSGGRSDAAANWLSENGFKAYSLAGGINAWNKESKPLIVDKPVAQISEKEYLASIPTDKTVLVDISATWCPPCQKMKPVLEKLQKERGATFTLLTIDGGAQKELCKALQIEAFPTFIIYKNGKQTWKKEGVVEIDEFLKAL